MCILCDQGTLELLTRPLRELRPGQLADAVRTARDAAGPGSMDHAEQVLRGEAGFEFGPELFGEVVVARALDAGVLMGPAAMRWTARLGEVEGARDPRVQAFVASCAEIVDEYRLLLEERRPIVERFVEARGERVAFGWLGQDGEMWFEYRDEAFAVLSEVEALEVVERELGGTLHTLPAETLLRYSTLPDSALEVLAGIQARPPEVANSILSGLVDLPLMADDRVRSGGYAQFFPQESGHGAQDLRFGEWVLIRTPLQG